MLWCYLAEVPKTADVLQCYVVAHFNQSDAAVNSSNTSAPRKNAALDQKASTAGLTASQDQRSPTTTNTTVCAGSQHVGLHQLFILQDGCAESHGSAHKQASLGRAATLAAEAAAATGVAPNNITDVLHGDVTLLQFLEEVAMGDSDGWLTAPPDHCLDTSSHDLPLITALPQPYHTCWDLLLMADPLRNTSSGRPAHISAQARHLHTPKRPVPDVSQHHDTATGSSSRSSSSDSTYTQSNLASPHSHACITCASSTPHTTAVSYPLEASGGTLAEALRFDPRPFRSDNQLRLLLLQLAQALDQVHGSGLACGPLTSHNLLLQRLHWLQIAPPPLLHSRVQAPGQHGRQEQKLGLGWSGSAATTPQQTTALAASMQADNSVQALDVDFMPAMGSTHHSPVTAYSSGLDLNGSYSLLQLTHLWCTRQLSNYEYLLHLNFAAGRRWGDTNFHPFFPWVLDFSQKPNLAPGVRKHQQQQQQHHQLEAPDVDQSISSSGGWADLSCSRYRQAKGDLQLDMTYESSIPRHHISNEPLSELSYCIAKARVLPKALLVKAVRATFRPKEYPASLAAMYHGSPDEALPEFYSDPSVFRFVESRLERYAPPFLVLTVLVAVEWLCNECPVMWL